nr:uncharacterized protein LOC128686965 [Cherax quadricarinatus]XP_053630255.1 uncharacterized protein LOC128686965 [Cherax quadricarinatus]
MENFPEIESLLANNVFKMAPQNGRDESEQVIEFDLDQLTDEGGLVNFILGSDLESDTQTEPSRQSDDIVNYTTLKAVPPMTLGSVVDTPYTDLDNPTFVTQMFTSEVTIPSTVQSIEEVSIPSTVESMPVTAADDFNFEHMVAVAPSDIFCEEAPKKRGRKRKSQDEARPSRRRRPKKPKVYEIETPFENEELERKRKNAQNAKRHRDLQKQRLLDMQKALDTVTAEKNGLQEEVRQLRQEQARLMQQIQIYQQQNGGTVYILS